MLSCFSCVQLFVTLWTVAHHTPLSMGFSRQEYWSRLSCCLPGDLPDPGIKPCLLHWQEDSSTGKPLRSMAPPKKGRIGRHHGLRQSVPGGSKVRNISRCSQGRHLILANLIEWLPTNCILSIFFFFQTFLYCSTFVL